MWDKCFEQHPKCFGACFLIFGLCILIIALALLGTSEEDCFNTSTKYYYDCDGDGSSLCRSDGCDECYYIVIDSCWGQTGCISGCADYNGDDTGAIISIVFGILSILAGLCLYCAYGRNRQTNQENDPLVNLASNDTSSK